jgi:hypothetical protein
VQSSPGWMEAQCCWECVYVWPLMHCTMFAVNGDWLVLLRVRVDSATLESYFLACCVYSVMSNGRA